MQVGHPEVILESRKLPNTKITTTELTNLNLDVRLLAPGEAFPAEYVDLRTKVYVDEHQLTSEAFDENDAVLSHILLYNDDMLVAAAAFGGAEATNFSKWANRSTKELEQCVYGSRGIVHPDFRRKGLYKFLMYGVCSYYRRHGRSRIVSYSELGDTPIKSMLTGNVVAGSSPRDAGSYVVECIEANIDFVMWKMFDQMPLDLQQKAIKVFAHQEIETYAKRKVKDFYKSDFYHAVINKTLTKQQYIELQANTYGYVQWTTRILAGLLGNIADEKVFKEISHHLVEEIGHPQMILNDMRECGARPDYINYVINGMVPNYRIDAFMTTQESAVSFRNDPVAFLGVPIAIEGITAFMPKEFITAIKDLAVSWGIEEPNKAISFWASHIIFDNPVNGHWARIIDLARDNLESEKQVRQILNYIDNVIENVTAGYSSSMAGVIT